MLFTRLPERVQQIGGAVRMVEGGALGGAAGEQSGGLIWISSARRGAASEIRAARHDHLADRLRAAGLGALADLGFTGLDPGPDDPVIITGYKSTRTSKTTPAQRQANQALSAARAPRRAWLQRSQALAHPHQAAHRPGQGHHLAPRPARPHPTAHHR